jgi:hypothetical protein
MRDARAGERMPMDGKSDDIISIRTERRRQPAERLSLLPVHVETVEAQARHVRFQFIKILV